MKFLGIRHGAATYSKPKVPPRVAACDLLLQVIKAISGKGAPACNCVALTGMTGEAKMFRTPRKIKA